MYLARLILSRVLARQVCFGYARIMTKVEVIGFFGSAAATAKALGVTRQAIDQWSESVPLGRQYQIEVMTKGKLKARDESAESQKGS